ncbi:uncharacterized protein LOC132718667 [Ruditapes philippinarum]|uniref:uncharacterized protein LOC132718667 n=1 Tax=Ruditapes philippinarum TaxID=129788 RepID=UPI00295B1264|nr:uncharacterized protein LOC132718667 [Ruditapes philippinarum]
MTGGDGISNCDTLCNPDNHYEWSCKTYCPEFCFVRNKMAPVYGRNGFSDCKVICDPKNGYSHQSCVDECQGIYNFTTKAINSIPLPTPAINSVTIANYTNIPPNTNSEDSITGLYYLLSILIFLTIILILVICFRKNILEFLQNMIQWTRDKMCEISNKNYRDNVQMGDLKVESEDLLKKKTNNTGNTSKNLEREQTFGNKGENLEREPTFGNTSAISMGSLRIPKNATEINDNVLTATITSNGPDHNSTANNEGTESETDTDTEVESGYNSNISPTDEANRVAKSKGVVRVITEINLR